MSDTFEYSNDRVGKISEMLYLNRKRADVMFTFGEKTSKTGKYVEIPAHQIILASGSKEFDGIFCENIKQKHCIPIVDASAEAFGEFLRFFYWTKVELSTQNIIEVTKLCKKYKIADSYLSNCHNLFKYLTSIENVCWAFEFYLFLNHDNHIKCCENKIKENSLQIFKSSSFLQCDQTMLMKILDLVIPVCSVSEVVAACMEWSKAECKQKKLRENTTNLRAQFGESFHQIPFNKLIYEQILQFHKSYEGFFTEEELQKLIEETMPNELKGTENATVVYREKIDDQQFKTETLERPKSVNYVPHRLYPSLSEDLSSVSKDFSQNALAKSVSHNNLARLQARIVLTCDRSPTQPNPQTVKTAFIFTKSYNLSNAPFITTLFKTNKKIILTELHITVVGQFEDLRLEYMSSTSKTSTGSFHLYFGNLLIQHEKDHIQVKLSEPLEIRPDLYYHLKIQNKNGSAFGLAEMTTLKPIVKLVDGSEVIFKQSSPDTVCRLIFHSCENFIIDRNFKFGLVNNL